MFEKRNQRKKKKYIMEPFVGMSKGIMIKINRLYSNEATYKVEKPDKVIALQ